ncbi:hypothetical protein BZA77DRAFT_292083 [Pyronema omphalodes]|nr:hypothetical protein BZA77DRAFT_292083 [Pyronema omphalodes]
MTDPRRPAFGNNIPQEFSSFPLTPHPESSTAAWHTQFASNFNNPSTVGITPEDSSRQPITIVSASSTSHQSSTTQTPLSASAIFQKKVEEWMAALNHPDRYQEPEISFPGVSSDVAIATAELQSLSLTSVSRPAVAAAFSNGFSNGFATGFATDFHQGAQTSTTIQPSPRLPVGCNDCYDGGIMPCPECEEAMKLAVDGCRCEPGGIIGCDHPLCRAEEYDRADQDGDGDNVMGDGGAGGWDGDGDEVMGDGDGDGDRWF